MSQKGSLLSSNNLLQKALRFEVSMLIIFFTRLQFLKTIRSAL